MWVAFTVLAWAGGLEGKLFGDGFSARGAVAVADPAAPGTVAVILSSDPLTCADALAMRAGSPPDAGRRKPTLVISTFQGVGPDARAASVLVIGADGLGTTVIEAVLATAPSEPGSTGVVRFATTAKRGDFLTGDAPFTLCEAVGSRPSLAGTVFEPAKVVVEDPGAGGKPEKMAIDLALPSGWTAGKGPLGDPSWTAPDGVTRLELGLQPPSDDVAGSMSGWAEMQVEAFRTPQTSAELVSNRLVAPGAYAIRWRNRWGDGPWTEHLVVLRQEAAWEHAVRCAVTGDERSAAEIFEPAERACVALTAAK